MLNLYDTEAINLTVTLLFCSNVLHNFTKNAYVSQNFLLIICELFIFSNAANTIVKLFDTLKIKTNSNNLLLGIFFFFLHSEHIINTLKIAGNYAVWLTSKSILLFVWFVIPVIHAIASSFFVRFCWFLQKKMLLLAKFWDTWEIYINFLKLYIMIAKLHTRFEDCTSFYSNTKSEKKDFLPPLNLTEKWLTYQKKPIRQS